MSADPNYAGVPSAEAAQMLNDFWPNAIQQIRNLTNVCFIVVLWKLEYQLARGVVARSADVFLFSFFTVLVCYFCWIYLVKKSVMVLGYGYGSWRI